MSRLTAGHWSEFARVLYSQTVRDFCNFPTPSSYHAVQGRGDELWIDVREAGKLALVDVGEDQLVGRGQHRLSTGEKLVKVFCSFAALKQINRCGKGLIVILTSGRKEVWSMATGF